jgi:G:T-mismatch repair DNA endonuclease (very short patch repair protein)
MGRVVVDFPYDPNVNTLLKQHGCWWDKKEHTWVVRAPAPTPQVKYLLKQAKVSLSVLHARKIVTILLDAGYPVQVGDRDLLPTKAGYSAKPAARDGGPTRF